jgi:hypothetical protein
MAIYREKPVRKTVFRGGRSISLNTFETVVISEEVYSTKGEYLLLIKDVSNCKLKLDSTTTDKITIKSLTNCTIMPDMGRIDEDWDEIHIGRGACVELQNIQGVWYILSSDGLKLD